MVVRQAAVAICVGYARPVTGPCPGRPRHGHCFLINLSLSLYLSLSLCVCVCVCVCGASRSDRDRIADGCGDPWGNPRYPIQHSTSALIKQTPEGAGRARGPDAPARRLEPEPQSPRAFPSPGPAHSFAPGPPVINIHSRGRSLRVIGRYRGTVSLLSSSLSRCQSRQLPQQKRKHALGGRVRCARVRLMSRTDRRHARSCNTHTHTHTHK